MSCSGAASSRPIVVNNAGFGLHGHAAELDRAEQLAMLDLNVRALTDLSLRWIDGIVKHKGGILNVASVAGFLPGPGMAVYYASKSYVLSFTEALARELEPKGVRVTALCPGPVQTEFQKRAGISGKPTGRLLARTAEEVAQAGYDGLMAGKRLVIPGFGNRVVSFLPRLLPRGMVLRSIERYQRGRGVRCRGLEEAAEALRSIPIEASDDRDASTCRDRRTRRSCSSCGDDRSQSSRPKGCPSRKSKAGRRNSRSPGWSKRFARWRSGSRRSTGER